MPGARRTHCHACKRKRRTQAEHRSAEITRHFLRNGFTAAPCSSWCAGFLATIACAACRPEGLSSPSRKLDSSIGEPEPHGLTVRIDTHRSCVDDVHHSPH